MPEYFFLHDSNGDFNGTYHLNFGHRNELSSIDLPMLIQAAHDIERVSQNAYVWPFSEIMRRLKNELSESASHTDNTLAINEAVEQFYALTQLHVEDNVQELRSLINCYHIKNYTVEDWRERLPIIKFWRENERKTIPLKGGMMIYLSD